MELFSRSRDTSGAGGAFSQSFISRIWRYEKTVLIIIGFIIVGVISFSWGVEKGKRALMPRDDFHRARIPPASIATRQAATPKSPQQATPVRQKEDVSGPQKEKAPTGVYTVQVASFQTKAFAQKEEEGLKSRGHQTLLLGKNGYIILCVGKFSDKDTARALLLELKKRYGDCYIRRL